MRAPEESWEKFDEGDEDEGGKAKDVDIYIYIYICSNIYIIAASVRLRLHGQFLY